MASPSRREVFGLLATPAALGLTISGAASSCQILHNADLLSKESARGYRRLVAASPAATCPRNLFIAAGFRDMSGSLVSRFYKSLEDGAWLLWESPASFAPKESRPMSLEVFGIRTFSARRVRLARSLYVQYRWPRTAIIRTFGSVVPIDARSLDHTIGFYEGQPVGGVRRIGRGGVLFLGSMLGPHLQAGDLEAEQFCRHLLAALSVTSL
jgi:hypothetical protein